MKRLGKLLLTLAPFLITTLRAAKRPNILFIFCGDLTNQALSCFGDSRKLLEKPNIDRLAAQGMKFTSCLVPNSICGPSRATVLTGKYSHMNGFDSNVAGRPLDGTQQTFPKLLQKAGYQTALIGKWHLPTPEQRKQWDAYYEPRNAKFRAAKLSGKELVRWRYQRYLHDYLGAITAMDESTGRI